MMRSPSTCAPTRADPSRRDPAPLWLGRVLLTAGAALTPAPILVVSAGQSFGDALLVAALGVALVARLGQHHPPPGSYGPATLLVLVAAICLSGFAATNLGAHLSFGARIVFAWALLPWAARMLLTTRTHVEWVLIAYLWGCAASSLAAIAQLSGYSIGPIGVIYGRAVGLATHPNSQGGALAVALGVGFALLAFQSRRRLLIAVPTLLCAAGLVLSGSVTGMLAALAAGGVVLVRRGVRPSAWALTALASVAAYRFLVYFQEQRGGATPLERLLASTGQAGGGRQANTLDSRVETIRYAAHVLNSNWAIVVRGNGLDPLNVVSYNGQTETHNMELLLWVQGGMLLLVAFLAIIVTAVRIGLPRTGIAVDEAAFAGTVAALVIAQTAPVAVDRYFWLPVSMLIGLAAVRKRTGEDTTPVNAARRMAWDPVAEAPRGSFRTTRRGLATESQD